MRPAKWLLVGLEESRARTGWIKKFPDSGLAILRSENQRLSVARYKNVNFMRRPRLGNGVKFYIMLF